MATPAVYKNESQPDWGLGLVVEDKPGSFILVFEHAGRRKFVKEKAKVLVQVTVDAATLANLETRAKGRLARSAATPKPRSLAKPRPKKARFVTVDDQLKAFVAAFEGGFSGASFTTTERGAEGATGKAGLKAAAVALAKAELSKERFDAATPDELFESAKKVLQATNMVFPVEGAIPFAALTAKDTVIGALKHLLHGEGDYGARVERFAHALELKDKAGKARSVSWPLATVFGALFDPTRHVCVKPTAFSDQASTLGLVVEKAQPIGSGAYAQFLDVVKKTQEAVTTRGQTPRDLLDVYSFITCTHSAKAPAAAAAAPAA